MIIVMVERKPRSLTLSKRVVADLRRTRERPPVVRLADGFECARVRALMRAPLR
jgi:hypothetical protein